MMIYISLHKQQCIIIGAISYGFVENGRRMLSEFGINTGARLKCDDFLQEFNIVVNVFNM